MKIPVNVLNAHGLFFLPVKIDGVFTLGDVYHGGDTLYVDNDEEVEVDQTTQLYTCPYCNYHWPTSNAPECPDCGASFDELGGLVEDDLVHPHAWYLTPHSLAEILDPTGGELIE